MDGLKNNLLSVIQMCDKGYDVTFDFKGFEIKIANTRKAVARAIQTSSHVYILNEDNEKCSMGKYDES